MTEPIHRSSLALRPMTLLQGLSDQRLDTLALQCRWQSVSDGHLLMARADGRHDVCFLVSGSARVTTHSANGRQVTFRDCAAGEHFGDLAAVDGLPRSADVVMLEAGVVASLDRETFLTLLREEPQVAERVMRRLAALVRQLSERVIELSTLGVQQRLHMELLKLARAAGVNGNQARLEPAPRHAALAGQISTNREQVTRELNVLAREGLIAKDGKDLVLADVQRLADRVEQARGDIG